MDIAKQADARSGSIPLADLHPRRDSSTDPLPHEDPDLQGQADGPNRREGRWGGRGSNGLVEALGGELAGRLKTPPNLIRARADGRFVKGDAIKQLAPIDGFWRTERSPEGEAP